MKDEAGLWLKFADEDFQSAKLLVEHGHFNPCLQHAQQAIEKILKALLVERDIPLKKTHRIKELRQLLKSKNDVDQLTDDECELFDSIYLPSKYPLGSVLPDFDPDQRICEQCLAIVDRVRGQILKSICP